MANHAFYQAAPKVEYSKEFYFDFMGQPFPMTIAEAAVYKAQKTANRISTEVGGDGKSYVRHPLYATLQEQIAEGRRLALAEGMTYWEVYGKLQNWQRKVVENGTATA